MLQSSRLHSRAWRRRRRRRRSWRRRSRRRRRRSDSGSGGRRRRRRKGKSRKRERRIRWRRWGRRRKWGRRKEEARGQREEATRANQRYERNLECVPDAWRIAEVDVWSFSDAHLLIRALGTLTEIMEAPRDARRSFREHYEKRRKNRSDVEIYFRAPAGTGCL